MQGPQTYMRLCNCGVGMSVTVHVFCVCMCVSLCVRVSVAQADNCQGSPTGTPADATLFAHWLAAVRAVLNPAGVVRGLVACPSSPPHPSG